MKEVLFYVCEKCGKLFPKADEVIEHEKSCLSLEVGQMVEFMFMIVPCEGRIVGLHPASNFENEPAVELETDTEIGEVDLLHDGRRVWIRWSNVTRIIRPEPEDVLGEEIEKHPIPGGAPRRG